MPDADAIFRVVLDDAGYVCKVSDKGAYTEASIDKFDGLDVAGFAHKYQLLTTGLSTRSRYRECVGGWHQPEWISDGKRVCRY